MNFSCLNVGHSLVRHLPVFLIALASMSSITLGEQNSILEIDSAASVSSKLEIIRALDTTNLNDAEIQKLQKMAVSDSNWQVRDAAGSASLRALAQRKEAETRKILDTIGSHRSLGYDHRANSLERRNAIGKLHSRSLSPEQRNGLKIIAANDPSPLVRVEAQTALRGDFTQSMRKKVNEIILQENVGDHPNIGYRWQASDMIKLLVLDELNADELSADQKASLQKIAYFEPNFPVRRMAQMKLNFEYPEVRKANQLYAQALSAAEHRVLYEYDVDSDVEEFIDGVPGSIGEGEYLLVSSPEGLDANSPDITKAVSKGGENQSFR